MQQLKKVLKDHAVRYPGMQPQDAVKLIYQNEFGGGHLVRDEKRFFTHLYGEYDSLPFCPVQPRCEAIGNGLVRVNLRCLDREELEKLGKAFLACANRHRGSLDSFLEKLTVLREMTNEGSFSFSPETLAQYLGEYEKLGYPMVSHSEAYRKAYAPAYRIVAEADWTP